jgi:hypothetical protein
MYKELLALSEITHLTESMLYLNDHLLIPCKIQVFMWIRDPSWPPPQDSSTLWEFFV